MVDLAPIIATAQRLITENGRSVTLVQLDKDPPDTDKPWAGPTDPRAVPEATLTLDAVFVEPSSATRLGLSSDASELVKRSTQILIVSPGASADLTIYTEVTDGSIIWKITTVEVLKPGSSVALGFIGVKR